MMMKEGAHMEMLFSILIGCWLVVAGLFYRYFVKKEHDKYNVASGHETKIKP